MRETDKYPPTLLGSNTIRTATMFESSPGQRPGTTGHGRPTTTPGRNLMAGGLGSVPGLSHAVDKRPSGDASTFRFHVRIPAVNRVFGVCVCANVITSPPSAVILYAVVPASANDREGVGWVKARQRSEASSPEHRERSDRPRSDVSLVVSGSFKHTEQPGSFAPVRPLFTVTCILRRIPGSDSLLTATSASLRAKSGWCA